jgi:hypothetical protein
MARKPQSKKLVRKTNKSSKRHTKKHVRKFRLRKMVVGGESDHEIMVNVLNYFERNFIEYRYNEYNEWDIYDDVGYLAFLIIVNGDKKNEANIDDEKKRFLNFYNLFLTKQSYILLNQYNSPSILTPFKAIIEAQFNRTINLLETLNYHKDQLIEELTNLLSKQDVTYNEVDSILDKYNIEILGNRLKFHNIYLYPFSFGSNFKRDNSDKFTTAEVNVKELITIIKRKIQEFEVPHDSNPILQVFLSVYKTRDSFLQEILNKNYDLMKAAEAAEAAKAAKAVEAVEDTKAAKAEKAAESAKKKKAMIDFVTGKAAIAAQAASSAATYAASAATQAKDKAASTFSGFFGSKPSAQSPP